MNYIYKYINIYCCIKIIVLSLENKRNDKE